MISSTRNPRLDSLTSMRFFAAFAIVLVHSEPAILRQPKIEGLVWAGPVGVDFFFVLSGFVLMWSRTASRGAKSFYWNRFARVWPLHALTWAFALVVLVAYGAAVHAGPALATLGLVQAWVNSLQYPGAANAVSWSLSCEMFFYAVFPLLILWVPKLDSKRLVRLSFALPLVMVVAAVIIPLTTSRKTMIWSQYDLPLWRLPEFVLGIALACLVERGVRLRVSRGAAASLLIAAFILLDVLHQERIFRSDPGPPSLIFLPCVCIAVMVFAGSDADGKPSILHRRHLVRLGEWSFALYLIQWPILQIIGREFDTSSRPLAFAVEIGFLVGIIALSGVVYVYFERPVERWLRRVGPRGRSASAVPAPAAPIGAPTRRRPMPTAAGAQAALQPMRDLPPDTAQPSSARARPRLGPKGVDHRTDGVQVAAQVPQLDS